MKTMGTMAKENILETSLNGMELYEFIMNSFNIILSPTFWAKKNGVEKLEDFAIRKVTFEALIREFGEELSAANTRSEKALKKACSYIVGLYEVVRLRLMLFYIADSDIERIIYLLKSDIEKNRFGGLRSLRLNNYQAEALAPVAKEIGQFLAEWYNLGSANTFPEKEILSFLEGATDKELSRILFLLDSGEEKNIHGGLKSLMLNKKQCEICKAEGIDTVINMVSSEKLKRESTILIENFNKACAKLDEANKKLQDAGFTHEEIKAMLKCTKAYEEYVKCKKAIPSELIKTIAA